ncbi:hypothetical protein K439DRAFT_1072888 [Ramaria rubella]|nr:hypothetical protein K439DRAFT_1072888 [Ramaria rubella]
MKKDLFTVYGKNNLAHFALRPSHIPLRESRLAFRVSHFARRVSHFAIHARVSRFALRSSCCRTGLSRLIFARARKYTTMGASSVQRVGMANAHIYI